VSHTDFTLSGFYNIALFSVSRNDLTSVPHLVCRFLIIRQLHLVCRTDLAIDRPTRRVTDLTKKLSTFSVRTLIKNRASHLACHCLAKSSLFSVFTFTDLAISIPNDLLSHTLI
jgi:hypothetical protein